VLFTAQFFVRAVTTANLSVALPAILPTFLDSACVLLWHFNLIIINTILFIRSSIHALSLVDQANFNQNNVIKVMERSKKGQGL
jgi:hypothetical protein